MAMSDFVRGFCPMGCGETLFAGSGGYLTCSARRCPRPDAVAQILGIRETGHRVEITRDRYAVLHPLSERLDDALMTCQLPDYLEALSGPPVQPGVYRVRPDGSGGWHWEVIELHEVPAAVDPDPAEHVPVHEDADPGMPLTNRCAHCGDTIHVIGEAWSHTYPNADHEATPANLAEPAEVSG